MKPYILKADLLSPQHKITFKGETSTKTFCGVFVTLIAAGAIIVATVFFSLEIFLREAPVSRTISRESPDSTILIEDYPLMIGFMINSGQFISGIITEDFDIVARMMSVNIYNDIPLTFDYLKIEPCNTDFFATNQEFLYSSQTGRNLCINTYAIYDKEGNVKPGKPAISKDFGENMSKTIQIRFMKKPTLSDQAFAEKYDKIDMVLSFPKRFVDVEDFFNPIKAKLVTEQVMVDNKLIMTSYIKASKDSLRTDLGVFFEDYRKEEYLTFKEIQYKNRMKSDNGIITEVYLSSSSFADTQSREYLKVQTVFAQVGGIAKAITVIGKLFVGFFSKYKFYCDNISEIRLNAARSDNPEFVHNSEAELNHIRNKSFKKNEFFKKSLNFWKFSFWSKEKFNKHFAPKNNLYELFDVERMNRVLSQRAQRNSKERITKPEVVLRLT